MTVAYTNDSFLRCVKGMCVCGHDFRTLDYPLMFQTDNDNNIIYYVYFSRI